MKSYPVKVINNGINLNVFKPRKSDFREQYSIPPSRIIVLGVAFGWGYKKGLDCFIELAKELDKNKYQIVLVGTDDKVDEILSDNIISIHRTENQEKLAEIYTAADVFVNPTREENYPTVNMEAVACGTSVITFRTGGSPECVDENTGFVVDSFCEVLEMINKNQYTEASQVRCIKSSRRFDYKTKYGEYINLYNEILRG